jgi:hypothetical protein
MLEARDVIPALIAACPSYAPRWRAYQADAMFDASLLYVHLGDFSDHLVSVLRDGDLGEVATTCKGIEQLHVDGDAYVREAATIGLLEGIQNHAEHAGIPLDDFVPLMGPVSLSWWRGLVEFWEGRAPTVRATTSPLD